MSERRTARKLPTNKNQAAFDQHMGFRLHLGRILRRLDRQELGKRVNVSAATIASYESGAVRLSASKLYHLSDALNIDVGFFYEDVKKGRIPPISVAVGKSMGREMNRFLEAYSVIDDPKLRFEVFSLIEKLAWDGAGKVTDNSMTRSLTALAKSKELGDDSGTE